jgi:hypothetical protein
MLGSWQMFCYAASSAASVAGEGGHVPDCPLDWLRQCYTAIGAESRCKVMSGQSGALCLLCGALFAAKATSAGCVNHGENPPCGIRQLPVAEPQLVHTWAADQGTMVHAKNPDYATMQDHFQWESCFWRLFRVVVYSEVPDDRWRKLLPAWKKDGVSSDHVRPSPLRHTPRRHRPGRGNRCRRSVVFRAPPPCVARG